LGGKNSGVVPSPGEKGDRDSKKKGMPAAKRAVSVAQLKRSREGAICLGVKDGVLEHGPMETFHKTGWKRGFQIER